jgi:low affinity Fe/Cu permease
MAREVMPSDVAPGRTFFDRLADAVAAVTARSVFFGACVLLVVLWAPSYLVVPNLDTWQLLINTTTTIVTFLLVGLMQNTSARENAATQHKLNAVAAAILVLLDGDHEAADELRRAVGLEHEESA